MTTNDFGMTTIEPKQQRNQSRFFVSLGLSFGMALFLLLSLTLLLSQNQGEIHAQQETLHVSTGGTDQVGCGPLLQPCRTVQYAVDQADDSDEILIATGVYTGVSTRAGWTQVAIITKSLDLLGGYSTDFTTRDPGAYPTTLDAESLGRVMVISGTVDVMVEGMRIIHGNASGQITKGWSGHNGGGGIYIWQADAVISGTEIVENTARQSNKQGGGGGLFVDYATLSILNSEIRDNDTDLSSSDWGGGAMIYYSIATLRDNLFSDNQSSDGGAINGEQAINILFENNTFQYNLATGVGGALAINNPITIRGNTFYSNTCSTLGGAVYLRNYINRGAVAIEENRFFTNTSNNAGGGLYLYQYYDSNSGGTVDNNVFIGNQATTAGSGVYYVSTMDNPKTFIFRHNTLVRNGSGSALYLAGGGTFFTNTLLAENEIAVEAFYSKKPNRHNMANTLWDGNGTDLIDANNTVVRIGDVQGNAGLDSDGYHLTAGSDAIDAGIEAGIDVDIDGKSRPLCGVPDIGAEESILCHWSAPDEVTLEKLAYPTKALVRLDGLSGEAEYSLLQQYAILLSNGLPDADLEDYTLEDNLPLPLSFIYESHSPALDLDTAGSKITWSSRSALDGGSYAWINLASEATDWEPGGVITNRVSVQYDLSTGKSFSQSAESVVTIPPLPPLLTFPGNGEVGLDPEGNLELRGIARPGAVIVSFEDGIPKITTTASITGTFFISYHTTNITTTKETEIFAREFANGQYSNTSNKVSIRLSSTFWCPQRSYWEGPSTGPLAGLDLRYRFLGPLGEFSTNNWLIPGIYGFYNTSVHLYGTRCPNSTNWPEDVFVSADGITYTLEKDGDSPWYNGDITGGAHDAEICAKCDDLPIPKVKGRILIDPDGYVFDVTRGFDPISPTLNAVPGVTVTCMVSMPQWGGWVQWPAHMYNDQANPQVTGDSGYFAFFTPPGQYYLQVDSIDGYQSWRSPVVEVISQVVHVNVPYTPWIPGKVIKVTLSPDGPSPETAEIPAGYNVAWISELSAGTPITDWVRYSENPVLRPRTFDPVDPLSSTLGFDGGMMAPGSNYIRTFTEPGIYPYTDGLGHEAWVIVKSGGTIYLPLVIRSG